MPVRVHSLTLSLLHSVMVNLGHCLIDTGDFVSALEILEEALTVLRQCRPGDHRDVAHGELIVKKCHRLVAVSVVVVAEAQ